MKQTKQSKTNQMLSTRQSETNKQNAEQQSRMKGGAQHDSKALKVPS